MKELRENLKEISNYFMVSKIILEDEDLILVNFSKTTKFFNEYEYKNFKNDVIKKIEEIYKNFKIYFIDVSKEKWNSSRIKIFKNFIENKWKEINDFDVKVEFEPNRNSILVIGDSLFEPKEKNFINGLISKEFNIWVDESIISFSDKKSKNREIFNIYYMTNNEFKILMIARYLLKSNDFIKFNSKKVNEFSDPNNNKKNRLKLRFLSIKKIDLMLNSFLFLVSQSNEFADFNFKFIQRKGYLTEKTIEIMLIPLVYRKINYFNIFSESQNKLLDKFSKLDPFDIGNAFNWGELDGDFLINKENILKKELLSKYLRKPLSYFLNLPEVETERIIVQNEKIEKKLEKMNFYEREINILVFNEKFSNKIDQHLFAFTKNNFNVENFINKTLLINNNQKVKLLILLISLMRYINSEYKLLIMPLIHDIEEKLFSITENSIHNLLINKIEKNSEGFKKSIESFLVKNEYSGEFEDEPYYLYIPILIKIIQKTKKSRDFSNFFNDNNFSFFKKEIVWADIKFFSESENFFIENEVTFEKYKNMNLVEKIYKYALSKEFNFNLSFLLRKMSFGGLIDLISTLDINDDVGLTFISNEENLKDIKLIRELRNIVFHQDILFGNAKHEIINYEKALENILKIFLETEFKRSYKYQNSYSGFDIKEKFNDKISNLIEGIKNEQNPRLYSKLLIFRNFLKKYYQTHFGRNIFEKVFDFYENHEKTNILQNNFKENNDYLEYLVESNSSLINDEYYDEMSYENIIDSYIDNLD